MESTTPRPLVRVGLAFAAVMIGFVGAVVYIPLALQPLALQPLARRAEEVQQNYALSIRQLSELRGYLRDARMASLLLFQSRWDPTIARAAQQSGIDAALARMQALASAYSLLSRTPEEESVWGRWREAELPRLQRAIDAVVELRSAERDDPALLQKLMEAGVSIDAATQQLIELNATFTRLETEHIHAGLQRLSVGYVALALVGSAGAVLLLFTTLGSLRRSAATIARRIAELEAFAGQISHDLRSPLQAIQLSVSTIESKSEDDDIRRLAARATGGVRRVDTMIPDLLQFARSGEDVRSGSRAEVTPILERIVADFHAQAERAGVALTAQSAPVEAAIVPVALETILANLVENAIKYRNPGGDNRVTLSGFAGPDGQVSLTVEDTGIGIPESLLPRVFDPFFKANQRPDSYGLGLATVKRLIDAHRGSIAVESKEGRGTTFTLTLPVPKERGPGPSQGPAGGRAQQFTS